MTTVALFCWHGVALFLVSCEYIIGEVGGAILFHLRKKRGMMGMSFAPCRSDCQQICIVVILVTILTLIVIMVSTAIRSITIISLSCCYHSLPSSLLMYNSMGRAMIISHLRKGERNSRPSRPRGDQCKTESRSSWQCRSNVLVLLNREYISNFMRDWLSLILSKGDGLNTNFPPPTTSAYQA